MSTQFVYASSELDALAEGRNYYRWLLRLFEPHLGERVVEVGAGVGTFTEYLLGSGRVRDITLLEPAENNFPLLRERFGAEPRVRAVHGYLEDHAAGLRADALVAVNVLEHVPDDVGFLRAARQVLEPAGRLLLFVPAVPAIYGSLDRVFEHHRRYTKPALRQALGAAGFRSVRLRHLNLPGVLSWFVAGRVLRKTTLHPRDVRLYDRWVVPWVERLERRWEPPLGQSILVIANP